MLPAVPNSLRGVHAMGGMAAQIPIKDNPVANDAALTKVIMIKGAPRHLCIWALAQSASGCIMP